MKGCLASGYPFVFGFSVYPETRMAKGKGLWFNIRPWGDLQNPIARP